MYYHYRIKPRGLVDDNLSALAYQLPRFIVYLLYFFSIANP